jgi:hypothetical protein|tara:strand:- start:230 stop:469 length:240 start_codon:yes stop_codon:yes gene_type:complete
MVKKLGKRYLQTKKTIYAAYDILSLVVIILSFDKLLSSKSRSVEPRQVARLIEKLPRVKKILYDSAPWWAFDDMDIKSK